jgi:uncharacterized protein
MRVNAPWRQTIYALAKDKLHHPAWGFEHSERDYLLARELAAEDHLVVDDDVLFATAILHDIDGFPVFGHSTLPHGEGSAREAEPILRAAGFPMEKFQAVSDAMATHIFTRVSGPSPEARVIHDADALDFIGAIGVARAIAIIGNRTNLAPLILTIEKERELVPPSLVTNAGKRRAIERLAETDAFLAAYSKETYGKTVQ